MSAFPFPVDAANVEQAGDWDGDEGEHWATHHEGYERLLGVFDEALIEAGDIRADDRVLDVGCGTGATTRALAARAVQGSVFGVDLSGPMLALARAEGDRAGLRNVAFGHGDAQVYPFDTASFDVAVSRMGCMFFGDPAAAFANVGRALRPGGRLALMVWQSVSANSWVTAIDSALGEEVSRDSDADEPGDYTPGPFSLANPELCRAVLTSAGFVDVSVQGLDVPVAFGTVSDAQGFVEAWIDADLDEAGRAEASSSVHRLLVENATSEGVRLPSATWLVTARRPNTS